MDEPDAQTGPALAAGTLYVVATPIGNRGDITARAVEVLGGVDAVLAEDTRHTGSLLAHLGLRRPLRSLHEHNERAVLGDVLARLGRGETLALVSDAGTPLLSDPGYHLVRAAREAGCTVVPIPGPSAAVCALSIAGLPTDRFAFEGFLPARAGPREQRLRALATEPRTMVFYEAPHRVVAAVDAMLAAFGAARPAVIARELTKRFETVRGGSLADLAAWLRDDPGQQRGEFVVVVGGAPPGEESGWPERDAALLLSLLEELPLARAVAVVARVTGRRRNDVYREALRRSGDEPEE